VLVVWLVGLDCWLIIGAMDDQCRCLLLKGVTVGDGFSSLVVLVDS
jgi:hypothetical protein